MNLKIEKMILKNIYIIHCIVNYQKKIKNQKLKIKN